MSFLFREQLGGMEEGEKGSNGGAVNAIALNRKQICYGVISGG